MKCAVCAREGKGFCYFNPRLSIGELRHYPDRQVFCSSRCQIVFYKLMEKTGGHMIDPTEMETSAMHASLSPLGEYVASIGMQRPLADYSKEEVLMLIEVVVTAYQEHMRLEHERIAAKDRAFFEGRLARQGKPASMGVPF